MSTCPTSASSSGAAQDMRSSTNARHTPHASIAYQAMLWRAYGSWEVHGGRGTASCQHGVSDFVCSVCRSVSIVRRVRDPGAAGLMHASCLWIVGDGWWCGRDMGCRTRDWSVRGAPRHTGGVIVVSRETPALCVCVCACCIPVAALIVFASSENGTGRG